MEWAYLATAPDQVTAEMWAELLRNEGIQARLDPADAASFLGLSPRPCRLLVAGPQVHRAREVLREHGLAAGQ